MVGNSKIKKIHISITGSKGKTSIMFLIAYMIKKQNSSLNILKASSTEGLFYNDRLIKYPQQDEYLKPVDIQGNNIEYNFFLSEATSFLISQGIYDNYNSDIAIFSGIELTEHLDVHNNFENYLAAKKRLFDNLSSDSIAIINTDGKYAKKILEDCKSKKIITYGMNSNSMFSFTQKKIDKRYMILELEFNGSRYRIKTKLLGIHNAYNIVASIVALHMLGYSIFDCAQILKYFPGVAGRFQRYYLPKNNILIIDYAHTPESLRLTLETIRLIYKNKKIITVFGCGGDKSKAKRPLMGRVASDHSDFIIITSDNNRSEKFNKIKDDILNNVKSSNYQVIENRELAVLNAIQCALNSVILLAGKGAEKYIEKKIELIKCYCQKCKTEREHKLIVPLNHKIAMSDEELVYSCINKLNINIINSFTINSRLKRILFP